MFLQKIFNFLNSVAENLIITLAIGKTMCISEIYFSQIGFYLAHFYEKIQWKFKKLSGASALPWIRWGGSQHPPPPPKPQLIIVIAARSFSQNSKKTRPTNFSLIWPLLWLMFEPVLSIGMMHYSADIFSSEYIVPPCHVFESTH